MSAIHTEFSFEEQIEQHLLSKDGGYVRVSAERFDRERALFTNEITRFLKATQPREWEQLEKLHGSNTASVILNDLVKALKIQGSLATIRHGFKCFG